MTHHFVPASQYPSMSTFQSAMISILDASAVYEWPVVTGWSTQRVKHALAYGVALDMREAGKIRIFDAP